MNESIRSYLDYYSNLEFDPNYAVLINGEWGSGKTWFVKNYFEESQCKHIYITLYGVSSISDIDDQFFQQLHPVLSKKGMMIAGKIIKGLAKGVLKVDLSLFGKKDGELNIDIPNIIVPNYLKSTKEHILIFDDLERAELPAEALLGYINQFVEHNGQKVIIIASEDEIDNPEKYRKIKEKVIGRSFSIKSSFQEPFDAFIKVYNDDIELKQKVIDHKDKIEQIFNSSGSNNLRHLRHGLTEFKRILTSIKSNCKDCFSNDNVISDIIGFYFPIYIEINSGNLAADDLIKFSVKIFSESLRAQEQDDDPKLVELVKKYPTIQFDNIVLGDDFWYVFFKTGSINTRPIKSIRSSSRYFKKNQPVWLKLWNYFYLTNEEFESVIAQVEEIYEKKSFSSFSELAHLTGSLMKLKEIDVYHKSKDDILNEAKQCLDELFTNKVIPIKIERYQRDITSDHSMGYQYQGIDIQEFKDFLNYFKDQYEKERVKLIEQLAVELTGIMLDDINNFISMISTQSPKNYHLVSFIDKFDLNKFVENFKKINPTERREVILAFDQRLSYSRLSKEELDWLDNFCKKIKEVFPSDDNSIESYNANKAAALLESKISNIK